MVKDPDFVYGIVPALGEYGFETQPPDSNIEMIARVQKLASSFEWTGIVPLNSVAIALDPATPVLVARYTTDTSDPNGRLSLLLNVWIADDESAVLSLIDELWPNQKIEVTQQKFLESSGRRIAGPERSFAGTGFKNAWGARSSDTTTSGSRITRPVSRIDRPAKESSSQLLKVFAGLMTLLCIGLAGYCVHLFKENSRNSDDAIQYVAERDEAQENLEAKKAAINSLKEKHTETVKELKREIDSLKKSNARRTEEVTRLEREIEKDPKKIDQVAFRKLQHLHQTVAEIIPALQENLDKIKSSLDPKKKSEKDLIGSGIKSFMPNKEGK